MSVWLTIPSARPAAEANIALRRWSEMGYKIALFIDRGNPEVEARQKIGDFRAVGEYPGYAQAVNGLIRNVMSYDPSAEWFVCAGDDTLPDPKKHADIIARECGNHFHNSSGCVGPWTECPKAATFGVMQPTGDRFAGGSIDRIAGSAWIGREYCGRANQGQGPFYPAFTHMFGDECLKRTAEKLGVYWMRPDLIHFHNHFMRASEGIHSPAVTKDIPAHLVQWNSPEHWEEMKTIFQRLEAEDFASCMPLAAEEVTA